MNKVINWFSSKHIAFIIIWISLVVMVSLAFIFDGTGDDGDSITHFLHAHYAFNHPISFFDHWAKPVYVLFASPWAYWGFVYVKLFNICCLGVSLILTYKLADHFKFPNPWLAPLIIMFFPVTITLTLSGLTEPLFAAWLMTGLYFFIKEKPKSATIWLSFLPFVRSEGLIVICIILIYLLISKYWRFIPLLTIGHLFYGFVGLIYYKSPLWVFQTIPYASLSTPYGIGKWTHFYVNMPGILGIYFNVIWQIGMVIGLINLIKFFISPSKYQFPKNELWLIYGIFTAVFVGHSIFWALGIFWSFGLMRVLIGVVPLIALISLKGINFILDFISKINVKVSKVFICFIIVIGIFNLKSSLHPSFFKLNAFQVLLKRTALKYGKLWEAEKPTPVIYYNVPYLSLVLPEIFNYFNSSKRKMAINLYDGSPLPEHFYYIWDPGYAFYEGGGPLSKAINDKRLKLFSSESEYDNFYGETRNIYIFTKDTSTFSVKGTLYSYSNEKEIDRFENSEEFKGKKVCKVFKDNQYSLGFKQFTRLITPPPKSIKLKVTLKIKTDFFPKNEWENARLVYSIDANGKNRFWEGIPIQPRILKSSDWQEFEHEMVLPGNRTVDDELGIIVWSPNENPVYIKDFKVELLE